MAESGSLLALFLRTWRLERLIGQAKSRGNPGVFTAKRRQSRWADCPSISEQNWAPRRPPLRAAIQNNLQRPRAPPRRAAAANRPGTGRVPSRSLAAKRGTSSVCRLRNRANLMPVPLVPPDPCALGALSRANRVAGPISAQPATLRRSGAAVASLVPNSMRMTGETARAHDSLGPK